MTDSNTGYDATVYAFSWHPTYAGRTVDTVRAELASTIASDQRAYALALEAAEEYESSSLEAVVALERKWGPFDLNWAEADSNQLADRVVRFEWERERRQELFPPSTFRAEQPPISDQDGEHRDPVGSLRLESNVARGIVITVMIVVVLLLWWFFIR
jgi:hypothetical protein